MKPIGLTLNWVTTNHISAYERLCELEQLVIDQAKRIEDLEWENKGIAERREIALAAPPLY
jgi:hypothetical protein